MPTDEMFELFENHDTSGGRGILQRDCRSGRGTYSVIDAILPDARWLGPGGHGAKPIRSRQELARAGRGTRSYEGQTLDTAERLSLRLLSSDLILVGEQHSAANM